MQQQMEMSSEEEDEEQPQPDVFDDGAEEAIEDGELMYMTELPQQGQKKSKSSGVTAGASLEQQATQLQ